MGRSASSVTKLGARTSRGTAWDRRRRRGSRRARRAGDSTRVDLALGHAVALGDELEVVDERRHRGGELAARAARPCGRRRCTGPGHAVEGRWRPPRVDSPHLADRAPSSDRRRRRPSRPARRSRRGRTPRYACALRRSSPPPRRVGRRSRPAERRSRRRRAGPSPFVRSSQIWVWSTEPRSRRPPSGCARRTSGTQSSSRAGMSSRPADLEVAVVHARAEDHPNRSRMVSRSR